MIDIALLLLPVIFFAVVFILRRFIVEPRMRDRPAKPRRTGIPSIDKIYEEIASNQRDNPDFYRDPDAPKTKLDLLEDVNEELVAIEHLLTESGQRIKVETRKRYSVPFDPVEVTTFGDKERRFVDP